MAKYGSKDYVEELINKPPSYTDSADTLAARDKLTEYEGKLSTDPYKGTYVDQINNMVSSYLGRDKFNYNPNNDSIYQQIRDTYLGSGKVAMQDTLGSGARLSGGNNNSSAQVAAQQTYNKYTNALSDKISDLENTAYGRYRNDNTDLLSKIDLLTSLDSSEYLRHQDEINNIRNILSYYDTKYNNSVNKDQTSYNNNLNIWQNKLSTGQTEYINSKDDIITLMLSGVEVDDATGASVGLSKNVMSAIREAVAEEKYYERYT